MACDLGCVGGEVEYGRKNIPVWGHVSMSGTALHNSLYSSEPQFCLLTMRNIKGLLAQESTCVI